MNEFRVILYNFFCAILQVLQSLHRLGWLELALVRVWRRWAGPEMGEYLMVLRWAGTGRWSGDCSQLDKRSPMSKVSSVR